MAMWHVAFFRGTWVLGCTLVTTLGAAQSRSESAASVPGTAEASGAATAGASANFQLEGGSVVLLQGSARAKLGIADGVSAILLAGTELYVARGTAGVAVYDVSTPTAPRLLREHATSGGFANAFTTIDGQVWVLVTSKLAMPVGAANRASGESPAVPVVAPLAAAPSAAVTPITPPQPKPAEATEAENYGIRLVSPGVVEIATGAEKRTKLGDHFAVYRTDRRAGVGNESFTGEIFVGVAEVVAVRAESCLAEMSRMATPRANDYARKSRRAEEERSVFPTRVPNMGEYSAVLRPLLNIGTPLGVGVLADLELTYWGQAYFAGATVQPLGIGTSADGRVVSIAALAEGGYDGKAFSVGLGAGAAWVNGNIDDMLGATSMESGSTGTSTTVTEQDTHGAFAVSQVARLGARDGLRLQLRNVLLLHRESDSKQRGFIYGGTSGKVTIPTGRTADFFFEGGGGVMGYWFFGVGVGTWILGNGSPGSVHLSVSAGGAGIYSSRRVTSTYTYSDGQSWTSSSDDTFGVAGPMVSIGLTRRFEF